MIRDSVIKDGNYAFILKEAMSYMPVHLMDMGIETRWSTAYYYDNAIRPDYKGYLLQLTLSGTGILEYKGEKYQIGEGQGFLLKFPNMAKYYYDVDSSEAWRFAYLHFDGKGVKAFYNYLAQSAYGNPSHLKESYNDSLTERQEIISDQVLSKPLLLMASQSQGLLDPILLLAQGLESDLKLSGYEQSKWLYAYLCQLAEGSEGLTHSQETTLYKRVLSWLSTYYRDRISLEDLARDMDLSLAHLNRVFKAYKGMSLKRYQTMLRMETAMKLLLENNKTIQEISDYCGYDDPNYFSKAFKKEVGVPPSVYGLRH